MLCQRQVRRQLVYESVCGSNLWPAHRTAVQRQSFGSFHLPAWETSFRASARDVLVFEIIEYISSSNAFAGKLGECFALLEEATNVSAPLLCCSLPQGRKVIGKLPVPPVPSAQVSILMRRLS